MSRNEVQGFTLLELMFTVAIIAILAATAVIGYRQYMARAASAELVRLYDGLRESAVIAADEQGIDLCRSPHLSILPDSTPVSPYAKLKIDEVELHYARPLGLHFKADVHLEGAHYTDITREAYRILNKSHRVAPGAVVTDSVVSFTALLVNRPCAAPASSSAPVPVSQQPVQQVPNCVSGDEAVTVPDGFGGMVSICLKKCPAGQVRDPSDFMKCIGSAPVSQQPVQRANCVSGDEAVTVPDGFGGMVSVCLKKCPVGQVRDPNNFTKCIGSP